MAKLNLADVSNLTGQEAAAIQTINNNSSLIEAALENTLSLDGTAPNQMKVDLDLDGNDLLNAGTVDLQSLKIAGQPFFPDEITAIGYKGWSPVFGVSTDGDRRVLRLVDWVGGEGDAPTTYVGMYVGSTDLVVAIGDGVNIRGASGSGTGDMLAANNLSDVANAVTSFTNIKQDATDSATGVVELATNSEVQTGTDTTRAVTPAGLTAKEATVSNVRSNTSDRILTTDIVNGAMAEVTLTDATTIAWDMSTGIDFVVTLGGNRTLGNPTNTVVGRRGRIRVVQDGTGSRTLTKSSNIKTVGGAAISLSSTGGAVDYLDYDVVSSTNIRVNVSKAWS